jgi:hypothetical protein
MNKFSFNRLHLVWHRLLRRITFIFTNSIEHLYNFCKINTSCRYILSENRHKQNELLFLPQALYTLFNIYFIIVFYSM